MNTFLRRLEILNYLRARHQARQEPVGTEVILQHLIDGGYVDEQSIEPKSLFRLIQRDLKFLLGEEDEEDGSYSNEFGLQAIRGEKKSLHWTLDPYQQISYDFERMPAFMALALTITRKHLKQVLPASTQKELARVFENADARLRKSENKLSPKHYSKLGNAVEFFQRGQSLEAPDFDMAILDRIYQAILLGKRLRFEYEGSSGSKEYDVHPFGVAIMLPKIYLIAVKHESMLDGENEDYRSFLVHKLKDVDVLEFSNQVPEGFSVQDYLAQGNADVLLDNRDKSFYDIVIRIHAESSSNLIRDLRDSPLNASQELTALSDNRWQLTAKVRRTIQLRNWLMALGAQAEILEPDVIRQDLQQHLSAMLSLYS